MYSLRATGRCMALLLLLLFLKYNYYKIMEDWYRYTIYISNNNVPENKLGLYI